MSIAIHHGAPGSFKSLTLVQTQIKQALIEGRTVVTNVRGVNSLDLFKKSFPSLTFPDSARLIYMPSSSENDKIMARWFHWCPIGALIVIDEAQRIYPDRRDFKLESLDTFMCPEGFTRDAADSNFEYIVPHVVNVETGEITNRPIDVLIAFDMHRHFQWDFFMSTPNIAKIESRIRQSSEWAYRHRALGGIIPFLYKNSWLETQHDPENNGKSASHVVGSPTTYHADKRIFKCYQSTATGEHTGSKAGKSIFKNSRIVFVFSALLLAPVLAYYFYNRLHADSKPVHDVLGFDQNSSNLSLQSSALLPVPSVSPVSQLVHASHDDQAFSLKILSISTQTPNNVNFLVDTGRQFFQEFSYQALKQLGYVVNINAFCSASVVLNGHKKDFSCLASAYDCHSVVNSPEYFKISDCTNPFYVQTSKQNPVSTGVLANL